MGGWPAQVPISQPVKKLYDVHMLVPTVYVRQLFVPHCAYALRVVDIVLSCWIAYGSNDDYRVAALFSDV